jgi:hypothetical protein
MREGGGVGETDARGNTADPGDGTEWRGSSGQCRGDAPATAVPMADVMADMPGVWRRLLAAHVPDRLGRCRGCRSDTGSGERWPCSLYRIAKEAQRLHDRKLTEAIDADGV